MSGNNEALGVQVELANFIFIIQFRFMARPATETATEAALVH